jgi:hypothetical protein
LLPLSTLWFAPTLRVADFFFCHFPKNDVGPVLLFPQLKNLHLHNIIILEAAIHHLIVGCTALEGLEINAIRGLTSVHIILPTILNFVVSG